MLYEDSRHSVQHHYKLRNEDVDHSIGYWYCMEVKCAADISHMQLVCSCRTSVKQPSYNSAKTEK